MAHKSKGSALITALFIMTLVAIAATAMISRLQLDIYRTSMNINNDKLYLSTQIVTFWAMDTLSKNTLPIKTHGFQFPKSYKNLYPDVIIEGQLIDLQSRFNVNNLQNTKYQMTFLNLLKQCVKMQNESDYQRIVSATTNWVTKTPSNTTRDEFLDKYARRTPPYLPAYQMMKSTSELRMIDGISAKTYLAIEPYITALPEVTPINLNNANKKELRALGAGLNASQVDEIIKARGKNGIKTLQEIHELLQKFDIAEDQVTLESQYFLATALVKRQDLQMTIATLIKREKNKEGNVLVKIINETLL